jgi:hypothetical protein
MDAPCTLDPRSIVRHDSPDFDKLTELVSKMPVDQMIDCPVKHTFINGLYMREIVNPAGSLIVTKIHKTQHAFAVMEGEALIYHDGEMHHVKAPYRGITEPGTQRAIHALTRVVFVTYHPNPDNETDVEKLEARLIAEPHEKIEPGSNRMDVIDYYTGDMKLLRATP